MPLLPLSVHFYAFTALTCPLPQFKYLTPWPHRPHLPLLNRLESQEPINITRNIKDIKHSQHTKRQTHKPIKSKCQIKAVRHKIKLFNSKERTTFFSSKRNRERAPFSLSEHSKTVRWDREKVREVENWNTLRGGVVAARRGLETKPRQSLIGSCCRRCQCASGPGARRGLLLLLEVNSTTQSLSLIFDPISPSLMARCVLLLSLRRRRRCAWCRW